MKLNAFHLLGVLLELRIDNGGLSSYLRLTHKKAGKTTIRATSNCQLDSTSRSIVIIAG